MFGLSCFVIFFMLSNAISIFLEAYGKKSEVLIFTLGTGAMASGLYFSYGIIKNSDKYLYSCGIIGITWLVVFLILFIGLFFFNGPIKWN